MRKITEQSLEMQRDKIHAHKTRLQVALREVRELRKEIDQAEADYEEMENTFLFGEQS